MKKGLSNIIFVCIVVAFCIIFPVSIVISIVQYEKNREIEIEDLQYIQTMVEDQPKLKEDLVFFLKDGKISNCEYGFLKRRYKELILQELKNSIPVEKANNE